MTEKHELPVTPELEIGSDDYSHEAEGGTTEGVRCHSKLLQQLVVAALILISTLAICRSSHPWGSWLRGRLHTAVNASAEATFGYFANSEFFQVLVRNSSNLVHLQEITKNYRPQLSLESQEVFKNSSWPVEGRIVRGFGWIDNPQSHVKEFNSGLQFHTAGGARVSAIAKGRVKAINRQVAMGWQVEIDHGQGWLSTYNNILSVSVKVGQEVVAGEEIARLGQSDEQGQFLLEVKHYGQALDPLSILVSQS